MASWMMETIIAKSTRLMKISREAIGMKAMAVTATLTKTTKTSKMIKLKRITKPLRKATAMKTTTTTAIAKTAPQIATRIWSMRENMGSVGC